MSRPQVNVVGCESGSDGGNEFAGEMSGTRRLIKDN